jgi:hypothetical protein
VPLDIKEKTLKSTLGLLVALWYLFFRRRNHIHLSQMPPSKLRKQQGLCIEQDRSHQGFIV